MPSSESGDLTLHQRPAEILQQLIRFDTTNPPGDEADCIGYIAQILAAAGLESTLLSKKANRPNLIARISGRGTAPPLLLYGHVDVVPTADQSWTYPPFDGVSSDGYVWGRGALDMKGGVAMMLAAFLRAKAEGLEPAGDIILAILADEEAGGEYGAKYLVDNHAEQFTGVRYAIGEFGGFPMVFGGKKFYAIQVAEKQICWLKTTLRGPGGHGSMPMRGGVIASLAQMLQKLDGNRFPVHVTPVMRQMLERMAGAVPGPTGDLLAQLLDPQKTDTVLDQLGRQGFMFDSLLHNTINATMVRGGEKINVIPSQVTVEFDGRLLPEYGPDDFISEVQTVVGDAVPLEMLRYDPGPADPDLGMFDLLADILGEMDPDGISVPLLLVGSSDARSFSKLNIQTYGFLPMDLPEDFNFIQYIHAADERIPVAAVDFGTQAVYRVLEQYEG